MELEEKYLQAIRKAISEYGNPYDDIVYEGQHDELLKAMKPYMDFFKFNHHTICARPYINGWNRDDWWYLQEHFIDWFKNIFEYEKSFLYNIFDVKRIKRIIDKDYL